MRKELKRHVLKGTGRAVPQLQHLGVRPFQRHKRRRAARKLLLRIRAGHALPDFIPGKFRKKIRQDAHGPLFIGTALQRIQVFLRVLRKRFRNEKPAVCGNSLHDRAGRRNGLVFVSGASIIQGRYPLFSVVDSVSGLRCGVCLLPAFGGEQAGFAIVSGIAVSFSIFYNKKFSMSKIYEKERDAFPRKKRAQDRPRPSKEFSMYSTDCTVFPARSVVSPAVSNLG